MLNGQVDDHTSDLWGHGADNLLDVLVDNRADLLLVVGVLGHNVVYDGITIYQVLLSNDHLVHLLLLLLLLLITGTSESDFDFLVVLFGNTVDLFFLLPSLVDCDLCLVRKNVSSIESI